MIAIKHIQIADSAVRRLITSMYRALDWLEDLQHTTVQKAAHKVADSKYAAVRKAEDKIADLEDKQVDVHSSYNEAKVKLREDFQRLIESLDKAQAKSIDDLQSKLADAALALVAADKTYDQVLADADLKLGVAIVP